MSQVQWEMHGTIMSAVMLEEWKIRGDRSIVAYANRIAVEYGLDKVCQTSQQEVCQKSH